MTFMRRQPYCGPLRAVIFDWAGTMVDYGCFAPVAVFVEIFRQRGIEIDVAQARAPMGLEKRDHIRAIAQMPEVSAAWLAVHGSPWTEADIDALYRDSVTAQVATVIEYADLISGALEAVRCCRERGLLVGATTGYSRNVMAALLPAAAARGYVPDSTVCPSDVPAGRPAPWMLYQNAINLRVYPFAAVIKVGDTIPDIEEALNAGAWAVAVSQTGNALGLTEAEVEALDPAALADQLAPIEAGLYEAGAHVVIRSVAELPAALDAIEERLRAGEQP
ncbi:MAG: phosphonoacetaldehyde hydrolase [Aggregatilineales bacterium]